MVPDCVGPFMIHLKGLAFIQRQIRSHENSHNIECLTSFLNSLAAVCAELTDRG